MTDNNRLLEGLLHNAVSTFQLEEMISPFLKDEYISKLKADGFPNADIPFRKLVESFNEEFEYLSKFDTAEVDPTLLVKVKSSLLLDMQIATKVIDEFIEKGFDNIANRPSLLDFLDIEHLNTKKFPIEDLSAGVNNRAKQLYNETLDWLIENDKNFNEYWSEFDKSVYIILHLSNNRVDFSILVQMLFNLMNVTIHQLKNSYESEVNYPEDGLIYNIYARLIYEINTSLRLARRLFF